MPTLQIIVGTYEKALHGLTATLPDDHDPSSNEQSNVSFADTFLFLAHGSAIRSLAISPVPSFNIASERQRVILASGGFDERINLYQISTSNSQLQHGPGSSSSGASVASFDIQDARSGTSPSKKRKLGAHTPALSLLNNNVAENSRNRELGSLVHHSSSVNALHFLTRSKLLSAADDNTIAVTRTRDWTVLSSIKVPNPKAHGRPSGDTAPLGSAPAGVNDFAFHPSMMLMVSVGKGEKCMRLWNLLRGKSAGVLNFEKRMLQGIGERRWRGGEGQKVRWNAVGEEFVVAFERGAVIFGLDCKPKARIIPHPPSKIHQIHYADVANEQASEVELLAVSTEDGRILLYSTQSMNGAGHSDSSDTESIPILPALGQLGGAIDGRMSRIKDFEILKTSNTSTRGKTLVIVSASSDGAIRVWMLSRDFLHAIDRTIGDRPGRDPHPTVLGGTKGSNKKSMQDTAPIASVGQLLGTYETGRRITCLKAFVMSDIGEGVKRSRDNEETAEAATSRHNRAKRSRVEKASHDVNTHPINHPLTMRKSAPHSSRPKVDNANRLASRHHGHDEVNLHSAQPAPVADKKVPQPARKPSKVTKSASKPR